MSIAFGPFTLNVNARQLTRGGEAIHLSTKAFDLLVALVREWPNVISKQVLHHRLWPDTFVAEANLSNLIAEIREALEDSSREPRYIRTVHRIGYAFCGDISGRIDAAGPSFWIEWGTQRVPLHPGEHVIGRDANAAIRIDASTVSRRHARILVDAGAAVLEDFGSKNGTFHGNAKVTAPVTLADGDGIRIGSHVLTFRARSLSDDATETQVDQSR